MSEMVDRVADAMVSAHGGIWGDSYNVDWEILARAAIEAMKEPTKEMIAAGWRPTGGIADIAWQYRDMIDEALK